MSILLDSQNIIRRKLSLDDSDQFDESISSPREDDSKSVSEVVPYLRRQLSLFGINLPDVEVKNEDCESEVTHNLANSCMELLSRHQAFLSRNDDNQDLRQRLIVDYEVSQTEIKRLRSELASNQSQLAACEERLRQSLSSNRREAETIRTDRDNQKKLLSASIQQLTKCKHDARKAERITETLKSHLTAALDKAGNAKGNRAPPKLVQPNIEITKDGIVQRSTWNKDQPSFKGEEQLLRNLIRDYERRLCELTAENNALRECLRCVLAETGAEIALEDTDECQEPIEDLDKLTASLDAAPFALIRADIEKFIRQKWRATKKAMRKSQMNEFDVDEGRVDEDCDEDESIVDKGLISAREKLYSQLSNPIEPSSSKKLRTLFKNLSEKEVIPNSPTLNFDSDSS